MTVGKKCQLQLSHVGNFSADRSRANTQILFVIVSALCDKKASISRYFIGVAAAAIFGVVGLGFKDLAADLVR